MLLPPHAHFLSDQFISFPEGKNISCADMKLITSKFNCQHLKNKEPFILQNTVSRTIGILFSGVLKSTSAKAREENKIRAMYFEGFNNVVIDCNSFGKNNVSRFGIYSRKESTLLTISETDFNDLCRTLPLFDLIGRNMLTDSCNAHQNWLLNIEHLESDEKLKWFKANFPKEDSDFYDIEKMFLLDISKNNIKNKATKTP